jgi:hypothetical protein
MRVELVSGALLGAGKRDLRSRVLLGGRQESNPHSQLGRLVSQPSRLTQLMAMTRRYDILTPLRCLFG